MFSLIVLADVLARGAGLSMLIGYLNYLILSLNEGKIIEIIGDLESTEP
jgi:hypothetical protein